MNNTILYIHGFNSGPGGKSTTLEKAFLKVKIITPQLIDNKAKESIKLLTEIMEIEKPKVIVGTSLGGFYAMYLSTIFKDCHYYIINPSFTPEISLKQALGHSISNFVTGNRYTLTQSFIDELAALSKEMKSTYDVASLEISHFYIGRRDEFLDYTELIKFLDGFGVDYNLSYSDNDHRHMDITQVIKDIELIEK